MFCSSGCEQILKEITKLVTKTNLSGSLRLAASRICNTFRVTVTAGHCNLPTSQTSVILPAARSLLEVDFGKDTRQTDCGEEYLLIERFVEHSIPVAEFNNAFTVVLWLCDRKEGRSAVVDLQVKSILSHGTHCAARLCCTVWDGSLLCNQHLKHIVMLLSSIMFDVGGCPCSSHFGPPAITTYCRFAVCCNTQG